MYSVLSTKFGVFKNNLQ